MKSLTPIELKATKLTRWVGSPASIIVHTIIFTLSFVAAMVGLISFDRMLLVLTTMVSLEAIYLAIFIQMTVNRQADVIAEVEQDLDEIQEDLEEIGEDMDEIQEDIEGIQEDVEEIGEDVEELQEEMDDISEDIDELDETDEEEAAEEQRKSEQKQTLDNIYETIQKLAGDIENLKKG